MIRQIEGRNPVHEVLKTKKHITKIFVEENKQDNVKVKKILELARQKKVHVEVKQFISNLAKTPRHQGVIAYVEDQEYKLKDLEMPSFVVVVSGVDYEHNLGSIIRSAESAGANAIIVPRKTEISPVVVKSSAGASEHIPIIKMDIFTALKELRHSGLKVIALKEDSKLNLFKSNLNCPIVIIVGKEDTGVNTGLDKYVDEFLSIPMYGHLSSLNMAVAASVAMFETVRQKR